MIYNICYYSINTCLCSLVSNRVLIEQMYDKIPNIENIYVHEFENKRLKINNDRKNKFLDCCNHLSKNCESYLVKIKKKIIEEAGEFNEVEEEGEFNDDDCERKVNVRSIMVQIKQIVRCKTLAEMNSIYENSKKQWSVQFINYFEKNIEPCIVSNIRHVKDCKMDLITNNPNESCNHSLKIFIEFQFLFLI